MNNKTNQQADEGIKTREELDSIFDKYPFDVEMDAFDNLIEITVRETDITKFLVIPMELLNSLYEHGYKIRSISPEIEDIDGETFAVLQIKIEWKQISAAPQ